jgi:Rod binding domain-containing protein
MHLTSVASTAAGTTAAAVPQPRLVKAAHEFEAQMMKELMQPLNRGSSLTGSDEDGDEDSGSGGALGEYASESLSRALSDGGGFGIAAGIIKQLSAAANQNGTVPVIGNTHTNTVMKPNK